MNLPLSVPVLEVTANPGYYFERARCISSLSNVYELGPPPSQYAGKGRFNSQGVSRFYTAFTDLDDPKSTRAFLFPEIYPEWRNIIEPIEIIVGKFQSTAHLNLAYLSYIDESVCKNEITKKFRNLAVQTDGFKSATEAQLSKLKETVAKIGSANVNYDETSKIADSIFQDPDIDGIVYPGVASEFQSANVVFRDTVYTNKMKFFGAIKLIIRRNDRELTVVPGEAYFLTESGQLVKDMTDAEKVAIKLDNIGV